MATRHEDLPRQQSGVELILAPIIGAIFFLYALFQARRDKNEPSEPTRITAAEKRNEEARATGIKGKLLRIPVIGGVMRVQTRYGELKGNNLAASVAFQSFLSLFPLILVIVAGIGLVASNDATVGADIIGKLGLQGDAARIVTDAIETATKSPSTAGPIGLAGLLWSGLGLVNALQYALDQTWQVEERGLKDKAFGMLWLAGAAVLFVGASAVTTAINWIPGVASPLLFLAGFAVNLGLWLWTFMVLPNRSLPWKAHLPGAVLGALGMEVLKVAGTIWLPRTVANSSALYGSIGVVFAVLAWLLLFSRLVLYSAVLNVVRWERKAGTVVTSVEVPAGRGIQPSDDVTRSGRVEKADAAA